MLKVDPIIAGLLGFDTFEVEVNDDAPDPITKFLADAELAGAYGRNGHAHVARLEEETAGVQARLSKLTPNHPWLAPASAKSADTDLDDVLMDDHRLAKRYMGIRSGRPAHRIEKSANGLWVMEFDENNQLIRGYSVEAA